MLVGKNDIKKIDVELNKDGFSIDEIKDRAIESRTTVLICGQTCAGKTKMAINIARIMDTDIISLDSMQVYRGMNIGTDKYDTSELGIKQYMVDIFEPDHRISAVEFRNLCRELIDSVFFARRKIPVMAGGSGLYIRAVIDDLDFVSDADEVRDLSFRNDLKKEIEKSGINAVYRRLKRIDPAYAKKIGKGDHKRIIRAMEVHNITGIPFSNFQGKWDERKSIYRCTMIGLAKEKKNIDRCIETRVENMLEKGLVKEVSSLIEKGYGRSNSVLQAVGYKEIVEYLHRKEEKDIEKTKEMIIRNTKKLAKKQRTWFRKDPRINWISMDNCDNMLSSIIEVLKVLWSDL